MKHLIFDAGGVLVFPRMGDWNYSPRMGQILADRARDIHTSKYLLAHRENQNWLDESRLVGTMTEELVLKRQYFSGMSTRMGWWLSPAQIEALATDFTYNTDRYAVFRDVPMWLTHWQGEYDLGLLSDAMPSLILALERYDILHLLEHRVISTRVGATKPDRRMYQAILKEMDADPADCLFVDDRVCNLEGAQAMGIRAIQMARPEFAPSEIWDGEVVRNFAELDAKI